MKGFGKTPLPDDRDIRRLIKLIGRRETAPTLKLAAQLGRRYGRDSSVLAQVFSELAPEDAAWFGSACFDSIPAEERSTALTQAMTHCGYILGKDFSFQDGGILVGGKLAESLGLETIPPSPIEALESRLGVPFVSNLLLKLQEKLALPDDQLTGWVIAVIAGVEGATQIDLAPIFAQRLGQERLNVVRACLKRDEFTVQIESVISDVFAAAGGEPSYLHPDTGEAFWGIEDLKLLGLVWAGGEFSPFELAAVLTASRKK
jgi:hypothetical protein